MQVKKSIIVVAGGKGLRMGGSIPKQFLLLKGLPILMRTINQFTQVFPNVEVIVVLPTEQVSYWKKLCVVHDFGTSHQIAVGGNTRFHSVENGLALVKEGVVGIHDAVRPLVSKETIERCFKEAQKAGNAVPYIPINDSMRKVDGQQNYQVDRDQYKIIQTPQVFHASAIKDAFKQGFQDSFTDDASVLEANNKRINLVEGNFENIKITRPSDLRMAEVWVM